MGASEVVIKATGEDAKGAFFVAEIILEAASPGPRRHFHERLHEMIYVVEGELTMTLGDEVAVLAPGAFASIPPGVIHTFRNDSDQPVRGPNVNALDIPSIARAPSALPLKRGPQRPRGETAGFDRLSAVQRDVDSRVGRLVESHRVCLERCEPASRRPSLSKVRRRPLSPCDASRFDRSARRRTIPSQQRVTDGVRQQAPHARQAANEPMVKPPRGGDVADHERVRPALGEQDVGH